MTLVSLPNELSKAYWDKKKGAIPVGSALETQLKAMEKKYHAADWKPYAAGWDAQAKNAGDLEKAHASIDRSYRSKILPLKLEGTGVADAAQKLLKEKGLAKPSLDAAKAICDAVKAFGKALDEGLAALEMTYAKALKALPKEGSEDDGKEEESASSLLDPTRLLSQLQMCKRTPDRKVSFAFLSDGKQAPVLTLTPKIGGAKLFAKLKTETEIKTGAYGRAWITDKVMYLEMDKPYAGLTKKIRAPLKAIGFKVSKIVLASEDGTILEADEAPDDEGDGPVQAYATMLAQLMPKVKQALMDKSPASAKIKPLLDFAKGKSDAGEPVAAMKALATLEALLGNPTPPIKPEPAPQANRFVNHAKARLTWNAMRQKVKADLQSLEKAILAYYTNQPDLPQLAVKVRKLDTILVALDEELTDKLDEALNAADMGQRAALHEQARQVLSRYMDFVQRDPLVAALDTNPFVPLATHTMLTKTLQVLDNSLT